MSVGEVVDSPIRMALVGYGYWGANIARNVVAAKNATLVCVADSSETRRGAAARLPGVRVVASLAEVLEGADVDAVILATPAGTHGQLALQVVESGRDVLVEKPLAMIHDEAVGVTVAAESRGRIVMVGHTFLYSQPVNRLKAYIGDGRLGNIKYLYSQRLNLGRIRTDCSALWNFGPHDVSILLYLLEERPVEVSARGFAFLQNGIPDVVFASMLFGSGISANIHLSWIDPRKVRQLTVVGDQQMAVYDDVSVDRPLTIFDAGVARTEQPTFGEYGSLGDFQWRTRAGDIVIPWVPLVEPLLAEVEAFASACQARQPPAACGQHGADVVKVLSCIDTSCVAGGAKVEIDW